MLRQSLSRAVRSVPRVSRVARLSKGGAVISTAVHSKVSVGSGACVPHVAPVAVRAFSSSVLPLSELTSISPIDGRYAAQTAPLRGLLSEYGIIRQRVIVEVRWLEKMASVEGIPEVPSLSENQVSALQDIINNFSFKDAQRVKEIEKTTRHDVKAVEYFLKEKFEANPLLKSLSEFLHFACTSEDVNNLSYAMALNQSRSEILLPLMDEVIASLEEAASLYADIPMLSRTHGQSATPTTLGKEFANFAYRLGRQRKQLARSEILAKFNGV